MPAYAISISLVSHIACQLPMTSIWPQILILRSESWSWLSWFSSQVVFGNYAEYSIFTEYKAAFDISALIHRQVESQLRRATSTTRGSYQYIIQLGIYGGLYIATGVSSSYPLTSPEYKLTACWPEYAEYSKISIVLRRPSLYGTCSGVSVGSGVLLLQVCPRRIPRSPSLHRRQQFVQT